MKQLIYVPLERLDGRYTDHLDRDILSYLNDNKIEHLYLPAPYTAPPPKGMFLNAGQTIKNKMMQLGGIAQCYEDGFVNNDTTFFFSDLWFPGIEAIAYLNHFYKVRSQVTGIIHAGSFTPSDEVAKMWWARYFEEIILGLCDKIYCGSQFIKDEMCKKFGYGYKDRLIVTGLPLDSKLDMYRAKPYNERKNIVVFNGRNHPEKQPHCWSLLKEFFSDKDWTFIWTQEQHMSKSTYYELLCEAKVVVSFALQENFGYGIAEAVRLGCIPVLPNRVCYPEMYKSEFLYDDFEDCLLRVQHFMNLKNQTEARRLYYPSPFKIWFS